MAGWNPIAASADADLLPDLGALTARSRLLPNHLAPAHILLA